MFGRATALLVLESVKATLLVLRKFAPRGRDCLIIVSFRGDHSLPAGGKLKSCSAH